MNIDVSLYLDQGEAIQDKFICQAIIVDLSTAAELELPGLLPAELTAELKLEALCDGDPSGAGILRP